MQKNNRIVYKLNEAPFPAIMAIISFILFIGIYWLLTTKTIDPYYIISLVFALPFLTFTLIAFYTVRGKLGKIPSSIITGLLIIVFGVTAFIGFIHILIDASTSSTTDIAKYERILGITGYPDNHLTKYFPERIPDEARDIKFSYNPAFLQGGERFGLKYSIGHSEINKCMDCLSERAKWVGKFDDMKTMENGIYSYVFEFLGYSDLPEDFNIYLIGSQPYKPDNWNHGEYSLVAISLKKNEIIFLAEDW